MSDTEHVAPDESLNHEGVLDLNFVPDWARRPPVATRWQDEAPRRGGRGRDGYRDDQRRGGPSNRRPRSRDDRAARPPRRDHQDTRRRPSGPMAPDEGRRPAAPIGEQPSRGIDEQRHAPRQQRGPRQYRESREPSLPLDIRIIPDQQGIQAVARRVHHTWMAYPVMDLATIFLSKPELTKIRIEVLREAEDMTLHQCKECGAVALDV